MTKAEENEMHALAVQLEQLTRDEGYGWQASKYMMIGYCMERLATYCAVCDCQKKAKAS